MRGHPSSCGSVQQMQSLTAHVTCLASRCMRCAASQMQKTGLRTRFSSAEDRSTYKIFTKDSVLRSDLDQHRQELYLIPTHSP
jgi:hypothetical protein